MTNNNVDGLTLPPRKKCVLIRHEYVDGTVLEARGDDADAIVQHIDALEVMAFVHGQKYTGPCMKPVEK